jgi:organic radical activating enzyme
MQDAITSVEPIDSVFSITWKITVRCNYDCMYCPTKWHNNNGEHHSLQQLKDAWHRILEKTQQSNLPYKISFTGGEITTNKNFLPFLQWLRSYYNDKIFMILMTTNGSASYQYYTKLTKLVDNLSFSVHSEHIDEKRFFDTILKLKSNNPECFVHVNIMDEFWNRERIPLYVQLLEQHSISHSINTVKYSLQTRTVPIMKGKLNLAT